MVDTRPLSQRRELADLYRDKPDAGTPQGATKVGDFPTHRGAYPFAEIAEDGGVWKLDPAFYGVKPQTIRSSASSWGSHNGYRARTVLDGGQVFVQFTKGADR